ncbi:MAG: hypothetical protein FD124_2116 [Alphaproteobacteria bacterium]|nr:MAG: hypothetical protein FD124_2116 [Alphaproteobacteria bacterium]
MGFSQFSSPSGARCAQFRAQFPKLPKCRLGRLVSLCSIWAALSPHSDPLIGSRRRLRIGRDEPGRMEVASNQSTNTSISDNFVVVRHLHRVVPENH